MTVEPHRALELDEALLQAILGAIDEGIHVANRQGISIFYNHAAASLDGLKAEEVVGKHVLEVFPSLSYDTSTLLKCVKTGRSFLNEQQTFTNFKGHRVTTINSTWPLFVEGRLMGALEVSKDVTRIRELSERVVDLQAALGRRGAAAAPGHVAGEGRRRAGGAGMAGRAGALGATGSAATWTLEDILGESPALLAVLVKARRAAATAAAVLVYGETGTGKELLVQAIHNASPRAAGPFIAQNCAALPEALLEGILFGTARGGFTGAEDRPGLFELASGGSLYLDEVQALPLALQAKLLRVLQERRVRRVGELAERPIDVRVLASTNLSPLDAVAQGLLRQDLYYRINTVTLELPPLRERRSDVPLLAQHFLDQQAAALGRTELHLDEAVDRLVRRYPWPGNVRELEHAVEGAASLADGPVIRLEHLPPALQGFVLHGPGGEVLNVQDPADQGQGSLPHALGSRERNMISRALADAGGNISQAARILGIPRQTLQYKLRQHGFKSERGR